MAQELIDKIRAAAQAKNVDPDVAVRIAQNESSLDPAAKAKTTSAAGLFGVIDKTWREHGGRPGQKLNPDENIRVGTNVIASNTDFLRKNLGREPSPTEVYSAHFFGPTGASAFLSAAPNTPAVDVLGAKVIKANPQLQGKTVGEVKQMLSGKMGETAPAPAQTKTAPAQTESEQMMEGALRSGMSAKAEDLGSGYKAALALSFLGAEDADKPESDNDLQARLDREEEDQSAAEMAAYKPYNALKDLQLSAASPMPKQEPVHMAAGGLPFTPSAGIKGTAREELDSIKAQYDKYNADADAYNAELNKYKADLYDPYITAVQKYNDAAALWNQGPRTTAFGMTEPTAPKDFSMTAPTAPTVSQADYEAKGAAAQADTKSRQLALSAAEDPERYGLTINKFFNKGGEADSDEANLIPEQSDVNFIRAANKQRIGDKDLENMMLGLGIDKATIGVNLSNMRQGDKNQLAQSLMAAYNDKFGDVGVNAAVMRPTDAPPGMYMGNLGASYPVGQGRVMAGVNAMRTPEGETRTMGHTLGYSGKVGPGYLNATVMQPKGFPQGRQYQMQYAIPFADGGDVMDSNTPLNFNPLQGTGAMMMSHGGPVHRADGSPKEGERPLTQEEIDAASSPAFLTPKSGIGRKISTTPGQIEGAVAQGISETPYNLVGAPVDLATMAMRPFGYDVQKPVMGSEWIKEKMTAAGVRPEPPKSPTERAFYELGQLGGGAINPAAPVRGAANTAKELMNKFKGTPAASATRESPIVMMQEPGASPQPSLSWEVVGTDEPGMAGVIAERQQAENMQRVAQAQERAVAPPAQAALPAPPQMLALPAPAPTAAPKTKAAKMLQELPPAPPVTAEFPMVGRLDMFVRDMTAPVQKEQFLNQVKNKFRDYDLDRAEAALASFGPKDKITPLQLSEALANTYSPSNWRSVDVPPRNVDFKYSLWDDIDNVYAPQKVGTTNLFLNVAPDIEKAQVGAANFKRDIGKLFNIDLSYTSPTFPKLDDLRSTLDSHPTLVTTPEMQELKQGIDKVEKSYNSVKNTIEEINKVKEGISYPVLYRDKNNKQLFFDMQKEKQRKALKKLGYDPENIGKIPQEVLTSTFKEAQIDAEMQIMKDLVAKIPSLGGKPIDLSTLPSYRGTNPGLQIPGLKEKLKESFDPVETQAQEAYNKIKNYLKPKADAVTALLKKDLPYMGEHASVTLNNNPIGFARFVEHTVDVPGHGPLKGRYYLDLQSDMGQELRQKGAKTGSLEKDQAEYASLTEKHQKMMVEMGNNPNISDKERKAQGIELAKIEDRISKLGNRVRSAGTNKELYQLSEPFASVETRPAALQQLLMKNAIQAAMRNGENFVTFPGTASSQSHLYEGVLNNLRQVVKDMGGEKSGFEIRTIELPSTTKSVQNSRTGLPTHDTGTPLNAVGLIWGPEAADRISKTGVPFKKGGSVERVTADNRRYL